jgi:ABC-2 type transport system ATP-binding protein
MQGTSPIETILQVEQVTKVFRDFWQRPKVTAVQDLSFDVKRGEVFGLLGPNGSGKSTTIKMLLGLLHPTRGRIRVLGRSPREVKAKARVGYLPEESYLYPYLTSEETLDFYGRLFDLSRAERRARTQQLLEMIGLQHARRRTVGEFSKGMARRIGLAQALINDPDLVILDEPTSGLDPLGCRQMKDLILNLARRGKTVLMTSHLLADVEDVCDRIIILYNGRIQAAGPVHELLEERGRSRILLPAELPPETLRRVLAGLREVLGQDPELDHPRKDLEQFFLEVVARARAAAPESTGATAGHSVATYLAAPTPPATDPAAETERVNKALEQLVRPSAEKSDTRHPTPPHLP